MSLKTSVNRAITEADQLKSDKQLLTSIKEAEIKQAVQYAIREELKTKTVEELKESNAKSRIVRNILFEDVDDLIANKTEQDYYFYQIRDLYDKELFRIERKQEREKRKLEREEKQIEKERLLKEKEKQEKQAKIEAIIWEILKILAWIILAPILLFTFIFIEVLKSTK